VSYTAGPYKPSSSPVQYFLNAIFFILWNSDMRWYGSQHVGKYFRNGRELNWPEGASSRESIRAVRRLSHLQVIRFYNFKF
jgi:hypothetical protein